MEQYVDRLIDGTYKRLVLDQDHDSNIDLVKEVISRNVSFEIRYSNDYKEHAIHLI